MKKLPELQFSSSLLVRTPIYSYQRYNDFESALHDPVFRAGLLLASPALYQQLEKKKFTLSLLDEKELFTVLKYWNRSCYRPTPFGLFSGVALVKWKDEKGQLILASDSKAHYWPSWQSLSKYAVSVQEQLADHGKLSFIPNPTIYFAGDEYRYICRDNTTGGTFFINSIAHSEPIKRTLRFLKQPRSLMQLGEFIVKEHGESLEESLSFIQALIKEQFIISSLQPNITGTDYYKRISFQGAVFTDKVNDIAATHRSKLTAANAEKLIHAATPNSWSGHSGFTISVILEKKVATGGVPLHFQQKLKEVILFLSQFNPYQELPGLKEFATNFTSKYEGQWVPLMEALDPEVGIAYLSLGQKHAEPAALKNLDITQSNGQQKEGNWTEVSNLLLKKILAANRKLDDAIQLSDEDLPSATKQDSGKLPPSVAALFKICNGKMVLEHAGGASAISLIGRFTLVNKGIQAFATDIAAKEMEANPDVLFAEILHYTEDHAANIERRAVIYPYEIPVTASSVQPQANQIPLSDILLSVQENEIILWSKKFRKRVIPRLSTAYNLQRTNVSVLRFLGDLQHHQLQTNLGFDFNGTLPELDFYPRVEYKGIVLSLKTWLLKRKDLALIVDAEYENDGLMRLTALIERLQMPRLISINEYDNQLIIDTEQASDLKLMRQMISQAKEVMIREYLSEPEDNGMVTNAKGKSFSNQFVAALYHSSAVYNMTSIPPAIRENTKVKRKFIIASEWMYFKIYCHSFRSNTILSEYLYPFIQQHLREARFFFIRYRDPQYHLRIRFKTPGKNNGFLIKELSRLLDPLFQQGIVSNLMMDSYSRELERYGHELISDIEDCFCQSSMLALSHLVNSPYQESDLNFYRFVFATVDHILCDFSITEEKKERFCNYYYESLAKEFGINDNGKQQLKQKFREFKSLGLFTSLGDQTATEIIKFRESLTVIADKTSDWPLPKRFTLVGDLIHMHLNRLFADRSREQEMVIHYCMAAHYYSVLRRNEKVVNAVS